MLAADELKKLQKFFNSKQEQILINSFKALSDANRHHIFELLKNSKKLSTSEIAKALKISVPLASQHLKTLEQANLVIKEKSGQKKIYHLNLDSNFVKIIINHQQK